MENIKNGIKQQFMAGIEMLENAVEACPEKLWNQEFWYIAFHTCFFLDYYLSLKPVGFEPPKPFTLSEFDDLKPDRVYTKTEILAYISFCKNKLDEIINAMNNSTLNDVWLNESGTMRYTVFEILLYNMRHVQHHVGQLNKLLKEFTGEAPEWIERGRVINI